MAEEQTGQERTEQPTERRKQEVRRRGQVPRSKELNTLLSLRAIGLQGGEPSGRLTLHEGVGHARGCSRWLCLQGGACGTVARAVSESRGG